jgi:hypothetical protein
VGAGSKEREINYAKPTSDFGAITGVIIDSTYEFSKKSYFMDDSVMTIEYNNILRTYYE